VQDARFQQLVTVYENVVLNAAREVEDGLVGFLRGQEEIANLENAVVESYRWISTNPVLPIFSGSSIARPPCLASRIHWPTLADVY